MNLPNQLTVMRSLLVVPFVGLYYSGSGHAKTWALLLYVVATITDVLDGQIARKRQIVTNFGKLFDPLADKILVCSAMLALAVDGLLPAWIFVIVVVREYVITDLRVLADQQGVIIAADGLGKLKTILQSATVILWLLLMALTEPLWANALPWGAAIQSGGRYLGFALNYVTLVITLWSGLSYLWRHWTIVLRR
jgi:CDP-diacylglycerol---glycerol-3-phosphate 3-phosphatidyltransferase